MTRWPRAAATWRRSRWRCWMPTTAWEGAHAQALYAESKLTNEERRWARSAEKHVTASRARARARVRARRPRARKGAKVVSVLTGAAAPRLPRRRHASSSRKLRHLEGISRAGPIMCRQAAKPPSPQRPPTRQCSAPRPSSGWQQPTGRARDRRLPARHARRGVQLESDRAVRPECDACRVQQGGRGGGAQRARHAAARRPASVEQEQRVPRRVPRPQLAAASYRGGFPRRRGAQCPIIACD